MRITEPGEDSARRCRAECLDEFPPEQSQRDCIEQKHPFATERNESALGREVKKFVNIEVSSAHQLSARSISN